MENLDLRCAQLGERLASVADDKLLTDALSVLQEQGLYAFFLFLKIRNEKGKKIIELCIKFLEETPAKKPLLSKDLPGDAFKRVMTLAEHLDDLLFARDLLLQALMYGRYHAKVREEMK